MRIFFLPLLFVSICVITSHAQWAWVKAVGVSGSTNWTAVSTDERGNIYISGFSDKLGSLPSRALVTAKYNDTGAAQWNTKMLTNSLASGEEANGVDAAGNSYMMGKVTGGQILKRPDGTEFSYFLNYYFVAKYNADGSMAWSKPFTVPGYSRFQVMADGTIGIRASNVKDSYIFGEDTITATFQFSDYYIEITTDGRIGRSVRQANISGLTPNFVQWKEPGKLFIINASANQYQRGNLDLDANTFTPDGIPMTVRTGLGGTFSWNNNGFPNSPTTVYDPSSGHVFALMSSLIADSYLNDSDTIRFQTNNQAKEGYVVELDENMRIVRKIQMTNLLHLAVRDSLVVVSAIVRGTNDFGFITPDTTITTVSLEPQDGYVLYVMDRDFRYVRHGLVESQIQKTVMPRSTFIGPGGQVYALLYANGDLYFQGMPPFQFHSGTVLAKLDGPPQLAVTEEQTDIKLAVYPNPASREFIIEMPGEFHYVITDLLGNRLESGNGTDKTLCNLSHAAAGQYFIMIETKESKIVRMVKKSI